MFESDWLRTILDARFVKESDEGNPDFSALRIIGFVGSEGEFCDTGRGDLSKHEAQLDGQQESFHGQQESSDGVFPARLVGGAVRSWYSQHRVQPPVASSGPLWMYPER